MPGVLPEGKLAPTKVNPSIIILYGVPKVGKTELLSLLDDVLVLDMEQGAESIEVARIPVTSISGKTVWDKDKLVGTSLDQVRADIIEKAKSMMKPGDAVAPFPYRRIAVDTIDKLEDYCEIAATKKYKESVIGKKFEGESVLDLPKGSGYYHLRNEVLLQISQLKQMCRELILISHIKDKILDKGGIDVTTTDISLTGKLGSIVCAKADAIGYLYREPNQPLMVNFETFEGAVMGARIKRLAGQKFPFDWKRIYVDEPVKQS